MISAPRHVLEGRRTVVVVEVAERCRHRPHQRREEVPSRHDGVPESLEYDVNRRTGVGLAGLFSRATIASSHLIRSCSTVGDA
jgi:hypothetical protein